MIKRFFILLFLPLMAACSTNPATGKQQFTGFMSPQQELKIGAEEHQKAIRQYGLYKDEKLQNYVDDMGKKMAQYTERQDVTYKFYLLDSPDVNAFALPGGYVYVTRGIMALANSEAEFASVVGHEIGHITGRHTAERISRATVTGLGAQIISIAIGEPGISDALGLGANLYLKSHSRSDESEADMLGVRYLNRAGYAPQGAEFFFRSMVLNRELEDKKAKRKSASLPDYLATHPAPKDRVKRTREEALQYGTEGVIGRDDYLRLIDGMTYGDSATQGFAKGQNFYHPVIGFTFRAPDGYRIINGSDQIVLKGPYATAAFDIAGNGDAYTAYRYLQDVWLAKHSLTDIEHIIVDGMRGATASVDVQKDGKDITLRFFAIEWQNDQIARFVIEMPHRFAGATDLRSAVYSFRRLSTQERVTLKPYRLKIITAKFGDTVSGLSERMEIKKHKEEEFRVINGLGAKDQIVPNRLYKIVVQ